MLHFFTFGTSLAAAFQQVQLEALFIQAFNETERGNKIIFAITETLYLGGGSEISHYFIAGVNVGLFGGRNGKITIGLNVPFAFGHVLPQRKSLEIQYIKICIIFVSCNCVKIVNSKMSKYLFDC